MSKTSNRQKGPDKELEQLMRIVAEGRKKEKDYNNLED
jgi:hypothetical protein